MERNKRNKTSFMWRQVSSQASSSQHEIPPQDLIIDSESVQVVADDERDETSSQGEENHDGISSHFSTFQHQTEVIVGVDKDISFRSVGIDEVEESRGAEITLGGKAVTPIADTCSSLKHSRHIQVSSSLIRFVKGKEGATQKNVEVRWEFRSNFQHLEKRIP